MKIYNIQSKDKAIETWMLIKQTAILCEQYAEQALIDTGLTPENLMVLSILDKATEPVIPAELARYTSRMNQTIAGLLNRMEVSGYVKRDKKRAGHPYTEVIITPKGKQAVKGAQEVYRKVVRDLMGQLTPQEHIDIQTHLGTVRDGIASRLRLKVVNKKYNA